MPPPQLVGGDLHVFMAPWAQGGLSLRRFSRSPGFIPVIAPKSFDSSGYNSCALREGEPGWRRSWSWTMSRLY